MQSGEILVIGHTALDLIFRVPVMPKAGIKTPATDLQIAIGGPACNAAIAIRRLGGKPFLLTRIGDDEFGSLIERELEHFGIATDLLCRIPNASSSVSSVYVDDSGERQVVNILPAELRSATGMGQVLAAACEHGFIAALGDSRWPEASVTVFESMAGRESIRVIDYEHPGAALNEACLRASHVFFSSQGLRALTGISNHAKALPVVAELFPATVGVTAGEDGCYWLERNQLQHEPAFQVPVRETLAAGDVWHGAFTLAMAQGFELRAAVRRANAMAALKCMRPGGSHGMPTETQIQNFLLQVNA